MQKVRSMLIRDLCLLAVEINRKLKFQFHDKSILSEFQIHRIFWTLEK